MCRSSRDAAAPLPYSWHPPDDDKKAHDEHTRRGTHRRIASPSSFVRFKYRLLTSAGKPPNNLALDRIGLKRQQVRRVKRPRCGASLLSVADCWRSPSRRLSRGFVAFYSYDSVRCTGFPYSSVVDCIFIPRSRSETTERARPRPVLGQLSCVAVSSSQSHCRCWETRSLWTVAALVGLKLMISENGIAAACSLTLSRDDTQTKAVRESGGPGSARSI